MSLTLAEAAEATGLNRSTILRAVKSGKISGSKSNGTWHVEPAELFRVFEPAQAKPEAEPQLAQIQAYNDALALIAELRAQLAELRQQRDAWQGIAERLTLAAPKPEEKPRRWSWKWLRTTG
jgi:excisionase family DNA binding protein